MPGDGSVTFSLDAAAGDGGSPIKAYKVSFLPSDPTKAAKLMGEKIVDLTAGAAGAASTGSAGDGASSPPAAWLFFWLS